MRQQLRRQIGFLPIALDEYIKKHVTSNPGVDAQELRTRLQKVLAAKENGERCACGEEIWVLGSAEAGLMCFTCITGESTPSNDYELYSAR
jgi:hypothetical protein